MQLPQQQLQIYQQLKKCANFPTLYTLPYRTIHNPLHLRIKKKQQENINKLKSRLLLGNFKNKERRSTIKEVIRNKLEKHSIQNKLDKEQLQIIHEITNKINTNTHTINHLESHNPESWIFNFSTHRRVGILPLESTIYNSSHIHRTDIIHQVVCWQRAKKRQGTHKAKSRHEVSGSNRKLFKQKGTGRARRGDIRSPLLRHGGKAHPVKPRDYSYSLPINIRRLGLQIALSCKCKEGKLIFISAATIPSWKSKTINMILELWKIKEKKLIVIIHGDYEQDPNFVLACRNHPNIILLPARGANVLDIVRANVVFITLPGHLDLQLRIMRQ